MHVLTRRGIALIFALGFILAIILFIALPGQEEAETPEPSAIVGPGTEDDFILQGGFDTKPPRTISFEDFERTSLRERMTCSQRIAAGPLSTLSGRLTRLC